MDDELAYHIRSVLQEFHGKTTEEVLYENINMNPDEFDEILQDLKEKHYVTVKGSKPERTIYLEAVFVDEFSYSTE